MFLTFFLLIESPVFPLCPFGLHPKWLPSLVVLIFGSLTQGISTCHVLSCVLSSGLGPLSVLPALLFRMDAEFLATSPMIWLAKGCCSRPYLHAEEIHLTIWTSLIPVSRLYTAWQRDAEMTGTFPQGAPGGRETRHREESESKILFRNLQGLWWGWMWRLLELELRR